MSEAFALPQDPQLQPNSSLPASLDAERAILGEILLNNALYAQVAHHLVPGDFSLAAHRLIYSRMRDLQGTGRPVDMVTMADELERHQEVERIGGIAYLTSLIDGVPERTSIVHYAAIVREKALLRQIAKEAEALQKAACAPNADVVRLAHRICDFGENARSTIQPPDAIQRLEDVPEIGSLEAGSVSYIVRDLIPTGSVVLLAGTPGIGKSSVALNLAITCAMGAEFLGHRCRWIKCLYLDKENALPLVQQRMSLYADCSLPELKIWGGWVLDEPPMVGDPRLVQWAAEHRPLIIFDSLLRFHDADENSASEMRGVMKHLRRLAEVGATVLVLHHRSKSDNSKYRGSSDIVAAVDIAFSLEEKDGLLELHCFKSRYGPEQSLRFHADFAKGIFEIAEEKADKKEAEELEVICKFIGDNPGATQRQVCAAAQRNGISKKRTIDLLRQGMDYRWRVELGDHDSLRHFLLSPSVPSVPAP
jgi:replicative DNA helicase